MKRKNNRKKVAVATAGLALAAMLAGTFAWQSYTEWVKNHMQSRGFEEGRVTIVEEFDKETPIDEAVDGKINKKVNIVNTSSSDSFVRVSFEEMLHKLANTADGKGYADEATAQFPVIINDAEYHNTAVYDDKTGDLEIYDVPNGTKLATNPSSLKLYVSKDGETAILVNEKEVKKANLPADFDPEKASASMPLISGSWAADDVLVAQKVTGAVIKNTAGKYEVVQTTGNEDTSLRYWGYGVGLATKAEADWAGANVNVTVTPAAGTLGQSSLDPAIKIDHGSATVGTALTNDWYYNQADGYFYYTKALKAGSTTSSSVMDSITFPVVTATTNQSYKLASYNLYVGLEAIPASQKALKADSTFGALATAPDFSSGTKVWESNGSGWALGNTTARPTATTGANDSVLIAHFNALATIVE